MKDMKGFDFLKRREEKTGETSWDDLGREAKFSGGAEVSAMSPDVARMQEQARRLQEMQAARERAMKAFDRNFDEMNKVAGVEKFRK